MPQEAEKAVVNGDVRGDSLMPSVEEFDIPGVKRWGG